MAKLSLHNLPLKNKKVLVRVDFNVPQDDQQHITDDTRITASLPSIQYILDHGASTILMSHLGRPKGKKTPEFSLAPCAKRLSQLLNRPVLLAPDCIGPETEKLAKNLRPGEILLLENLRFYEAEEHPEKDPLFAKKLANLGDFYVNDAFGTAHRAHSSTATIAQFFPGKSAAGFLMEKEIQFLGNLIQNPKRPFYAIIGGAKISSKIGVLKSLLKKVDALLIGGGMAYTFMKAQGIPIGNSLHEDEFLSTAKDLLEESKKSRCKILLPLDTCAAQTCSNDAPTMIISTQQGIPNGYAGLDIGPQTIQEFSKLLDNAGTILWNGPLGVFELSNFAKGTDAIAQAISHSNATTVVGGGDSIAAIKAAGVADKISHISTGGGASLEYLEFGHLPGIDALSDIKMKTEKGAASPHMTPGDS